MAGEPLTPPDLDLRDYGFMPLDVVRLRDSDLAGIHDAEVFRANVLSWCVSWHQVPAASLPDDDAILARLLGYGRDQKTWRRVRDHGGLRGWVKCSDGRLYHPVVAEKAIQAAEKRHSYSNRGKAGASKRWRLANSSANGSAIAQLSNSQWQIDSKGEQGKGEGEQGTISPPTEVVAAPSADDLASAVAAYNAVAGKYGLPVVENLTGDRRTKLRARLREHGLDSWRRALHKLGMNTWMHGDNERGWRADFNFLLQASSFVKLIEGSYDHVPTFKPKQSSKPTSKNIRIGSPEDLADRKRMGLD